MDADASIELNAGLPPTRVGLEEVLRRQRLDPQWWSSGPGFRYPPHAHSYRKILYCERGSITFVLVDSGWEFRLGPGDRLEIAPEVSHSAVVGPEGVTCVESAWSP
jgi:hypothetical protein